MKIQHIRNATMRLTYAGRKILTDPMLAPKDAYGPFAGIARNPTIDLPCPPEAVTAGIDGVIVSHNHPDHFDKAALDLLPKEIPLLCQPVDESYFVGQGFQAVTPLKQTQKWEGITLTPIEGQHGTGKILEFMGKVSGFVFQADNEPTVFWAGDTIWCDSVEKALKDFKPPIVLTHSGGARRPGYDLIIMDAEQTVAVCRAVPEAVVVAIHLEALDHCTVTREALRTLADKEGISPSRLLIPEDGDILNF
jgi:L-ascorbate metabolism protein UlaG (beta-lactamase superfamily)